MHKLFLIFFLHSFFCSFFINAQSIDVNVLTYNVLNYPNGNTSSLDGDAARAVLFRQIVEDANADIIIVQELMTANGTSAEGLAAVSLLTGELNTNTSLGKSYAHATSYTGYGSTSFGFLGNMIIYNDALFSFISQAEVPAINSAVANNGNVVFTPRPSSHYQLTYPKTPTCAEQTTTLDIFSSHLKSGNDSATNSAISDEERRDLGAKDIIDYITSNLNTSSNIILGGDFNFQGDFEDGYITLATGVNGAFEDPLNGWVRNISSQVERYTQSTRNNSSPNNNNGGSSGGLDDRFDLWFYNTNIENANEMISYNNGTYQTWGSAGVPWNGRAGQGTDPLATELELMSDHFPVYMQLYLDAPISLCSNPCPSTIHITSPVVDGVHQADVSITSDAILNIGQDVTFLAGTDIELLPGFEVPAMANFTADIMFCVP